MMRRTLTVVAIMVVAVGAMAAGTAWYLGLILTSPTVHDAAPRPVASSAVRVLAKDLQVPWGLAFLPDGTALFTERSTARVRSLSSDGTVRDLAHIAEVSASGEGGLLGIAVSPRYAEDGWVYLYYSAARDNRIVRLKLSPQPTQPQVIFSGIPRAANHNGGRLAFGPDGMLYAGTGDAGDRGKAQDRDYLGGKILRLAPDGSPAPGNPFGDSPVYSYGHRNVQGLAWDADGRLFAAEFGQNRYDELNLIVAGGNYGWPLQEGMGDDPDFRNPVATWTTSDASPSGIAIHAGSVYLACLRGAKLYQVSTTGAAAQVLLDGEFGRLRTVAVAPDGALWVMTSNRDGRGKPAGSDDRIIRVDLPAA